eukprot:5118466-Heterocapsa_arctica.AAC.1
MPTDGTFKLTGKDINKKWRLWNEASEEYLAQEEGTTDRTDGSAITTELRTQQQMLSILIRKGDENTQE